MSRWVQCEYGWRTVRTGFWRCYLCETDYPSSEGGYKCKLGNTKHCDKKHCELCLSEHREIHHSGEK